MSVRVQSSSTSATCTFGDAEGQVHVGEAVAVVDGERAHDGSGDDALILLASLSTCSRRASLLNGEHRARW